MNIAVIGSNGFIGKHLVDSLIKCAEYNLTLFGTTEHNLSNNELPYYQITSLDNEAIKSKFKKIDLVYYLASSSIPASSWNEPLFDVNHNLVPFLNLLENISTIGVKKIAFISSAGTVYGPSEEKVKEDFDKHPFSPHGIIKLTMEYFLNYYKIRDGLNFDVYRISNVFGEGQNTHKGLGIINTFIENIIKKKSVDVYGTGENLRNYIYVKDVANLLIHSATANFNTSDTFNIASNDSFTINDIISELTSVVDVDFSVNKIEARKSDNVKIDLDNSKILSLYPRFQFTNFRTALENTYSHTLKTN